MVWLHLQVPSPIYRWIRGEAARRGIAVEWLVVRLLELGYRHAMRSGGGPPPPDSGG